MGSAVSQQASQLLNPIKSTISSSKRMTAHRTDEQKYHNDEGWRCNICRVTQSEDNSVCIMCGHNELMSIENEWQCIKCNLIQSKASLICGLCGRKNQYLCDQNLQLIECDKKESPTFCIDDEIYCTVCTEKCKLNAIIWNCQTHIVCDRCYVMKTVQLTSMSVKSCDLTTCHYLKRFALWMNGCYKSMNVTIDRTQCEIICKITIANDYSHLIEQHKNDREVEYIVNQLDQCEISKCKSYIGYNRGSNDTNFSAIDKMHCHFQHRCGHISGTESPVLALSANGCMVCGTKSKYKEILWKCNKEDVCDSCYQIVQQSLENDGNKCDLMTCYQLKRFTVQMNRYNQRDEKVESNYKSISGILNAYLHLMHRHGADEQFECIVDRLGPCQLAKCASYSRNNRNRNGTDVVGDEQKIDACIEEMVYQQMMDKIHCYFQHCYDVGNRLPLKVKNRIKAELEEEQKMGTNDEVSIFSSPNQEIIKISKILQSKKTSLQRPTMATNNAMIRMNKKYTQLFSENKQQIDNTSSTSWYNFGYLFSYGYDTENEFDKRVPVELHDNIQSIDITAKYSSFKEELTSNDIAILSMEQYNDEYRKAQLHIGSFYCKQHYVNVELKHILSVGVYCNNDELQYKFSKTYRENNGKNHKTFYHFGRYLKQIVHKFGDPMRQFGCCGHANNKFYHGVNNILAFPSYGMENTNVDRSRHQLGYAGIHICGPLSTSATFEVALNFSGNNGLLIEFVDNDNKHLSARNLSVSWLSDYGNENEYLFIQNMYRFQINSIIEVEFGYKYDTILSTLKHDISGYYNSKHNGTEYSTLRDKIISNQLSKNNISNYSPFNTLSDYGQTICNVFFNNTKEFRMTYGQWDHLGFWEHCKHYKWIKLDLICALFPNIETIYFHVDTFYEGMFDNMLSYFAKKGRQKAMLKVVIEIESKNQFVIKNAMEKYASLLRRANLFSWYFLRQGYNKYMAKICVLKMSQVKVALYLMDMIEKEKTYPIFAGSRLTIKSLASTIENLITSKISNEYNSNNDQQLFNKYCDEKLFLLIKVNTDSDIWFRIFIDETNRCLNMELLNVVFPNIRSIQVSVDKFISKFVLHHYSQYLMDSKTKLDTISICGDTEFIKQLIISEYRNKYGALRYSFQGVTTLYITKPKT